MITHSNLLADYQRRAAAHKAEGGTELLADERKLWALVLVGLYAEGANATLIWGCNRIRLRDNYRRVKLPHPVYDPSEDSYRRWRWVRTGNLVVEVLAGEHGERLLAQQVIHKDCLPESVVPSIEGFLSEFERIEREDLERAVVRGRW